MAGDICSCGADIPAPDGEERDYDAQPLTSAEIQETIRYIHRWQVFEHYPKRILDANGVIVIAEAQTEERAAQIVVEHNAVPQLVAALTNMLDKFYPHRCKFHGPSICDKCEALRQATTTLTTLRKGA